MKVRVPKNGCEATLNASAENGSVVLGSRETFSSSLPTAWPTMAGTSSGEGR